MAGGHKKHAQNEQYSRTSSSGSSSGAAASSSKSVARLDGNRDVVDPAVEYSKLTDLKNISEFLGLLGWNAARGEQTVHTLPQRKGFNPHGNECTIMLNMFNLKAYPNMTVHQYDISFTGDGDYSKRQLLRKIWDSKPIKEGLDEPASRFIFDGNKLAWSGKRLPRDEFRLEVDLDKEEGRTSRPGSRGNKHKMYLKWTRRIDFAALRSFLDGQVSWSNTAIDTINFLDHVLREQPSRQYTQIKKSFFQRGQQRFDLGQGVEAFRGVFSSLRPVLDNAGKRGLAVNVDVANGTFWRPGPLKNTLLACFDLDGARFTSRFREAKSKWHMSMMKRDLRKFRRVGVKAIHTKPPTSWIIDDFVPMEASEAKFPDSENNDKPISVADYFKRKYNYRCLPGVPVVMMTKKIRKMPVYLPIDVLVIEDNQRYNTKLSDRQTSNMIRFAVTLPRERWSAVQQGVNLLNWSEDPFLQHYGMQINLQATKVKARVLPYPTVQFGAGSRQATISPTDMQQGRWRIDGRKLAGVNPNRPIEAWGVALVLPVAGAHPPPQAACEAFIDSFIKVYEGHGGRISSHPKFGKKPWLGQAPVSDGANLVANVWTKVGTRYQVMPNFLMFIVCDKNVDVYRRIKKNCDARYGVASQCVQARHVTTNSPQYHSNIVMKVNAKMGGFTSVAKSNVIPKIAPNSANIPTMIVGADVSHPAPGAGESASFAAITMSADKNFAKYWADVQTNGHRIEMITTKNINNHFGPMAKIWMQQCGQGMPPRRVLYIRDGVSEGQYAAVLNEEVEDMKACFLHLGCKEAPRFTVVIAGKRHHVRFFPDKGDRNGNPLPGTLVEAGCTHPFEFDFYLCSHVAIKGTARPIHYHCILNEGNWQPAELQSFIFEHSYQYVRSTTPVSLHPAVYYAHLAADRSRAHANVRPEQEHAATRTTAEVEPLAPILNNRSFKEVMWYV